LGERNPYFCALHPLSLTLIASQSGHAHRGAQFPEFGLLLLRNGERTLEIPLSFGRVCLGRYAGDFPCS
jgi:hypothetical protein